MLFYAFRGIVRNKFVCQEFSRISYIKMSFFCSFDGMECSFYLRYRNLYLRCQHVILVTWGWNVLMSRWIDEQYEFFLLLMQETWPEGDTKDTNNDLSISKYNIHLRICIFKIFLQLWYSLKWVFESRDSNFNYYHKPKWTYQYVIPQHVE